MAEDKNKKPQRFFDPDYIFNIFKLNKWFAIVSVLLLVSIFGMVQKDYDREWKKWQRKFRTLEIEHTKAEIAKTQEELESNSEYMAAKQTYDDAEILYRENETKVFELKKALAKKEKEKYAVTRTYQDNKSIFDALRYELEEAQEHEPRRVSNAKKDFKQIEKEVQKAKVEMETVEKAYAELDAKLRENTNAKEKAEEKLNQVRSDLDRLKRKQKKIERSFVNDVFRDAPLLDFIDPSLKVKEIIVNDLLMDNNFKKIPRIDSCTTCHAAIDRPGYEEESNPLKTHPRLDLFLSSKSPHPLNDYGCTVCHGGMGGGLTFTFAAHTPNSPEQGNKWKKKYNWHRLKHWTEPMLALKHTEATCYGCHSKDIDIPKAKTMNRAIFLVERSGCYGCHKIEGWEHVRKAGPSLKRITSKVNKDWLYKWIENPKAFRPSTAMPEFFALSNSNDSESVRKNHARIASIVAYLENQAEPYTPPAISADGGDVKKGKQLFAEVGCLGCHSMDDYPAVKQPLFGPDLSDVGSKVSSSWLAAWLKNPKNYWKDTRMPDLRLSNQEVKDLTAYLLNKRNPIFEQKTILKVDQRTLSEVTHEYLKSRMPTEEAKTRLKKMSRQDMFHYVGEKTISHYGCFGCHEIGGFEEAKPIGTELTYEASKPIVRFDFGFVDIEHTVPAWIYQKLMHPRSFDKNKVKPFQDKLKMPKFGFSPEEADLVTTFVLGLRKYQTPVHRTIQARGQEEIREGRKLLHHYNCRGCHIMEGMGGNILAHYEDPSVGPPNLTGEGQKVKPKWLFQFFKAPSTIRPWLKVRMPNFGFDDEQNNSLIKYFRAVDKQFLDIETQPQLAKKGAHFQKGQTSFQQFQCINCHREPPYPPDVDVTSFAPPFSLTPNRLRYEWVDDWFRDPQKLLPGTRMPNLFYYEGQPMYPDAEERLIAIRDYLYAK